MYCVCVCVYVGVVKCFGVVLSAKGVDKADNKSFLLLEFLEV